MFIQPVRGLTSMQENRCDSRHARRAGASLFPGLGQGSHWTMAALTTHYYLDILAKEVGMEAEPVGGDIEPALEKEVPLEGTGAHWEVTGEKSTISKVCWEASGPGSSQ